MLLREECYEDTALENDRVSTPGTTDEGKGHRTADKGDLEKYEH